MKILKLLTLLFSISSVFGQNSLLVKNLDAGPGDETNLVVALENNDGVSSFQFTLKLPNNLIVKEKETVFAGRNTDHVIYPKSKGNGEYLFVCFSASNTVFSGNSGGLLEIPVEIPLTYTPGQTYDMILQEVVLSSVEGVGVGSNHQNGLLTVIEGKNPDLVIENITFQSTEITPEEKFTINWDVKNIGLSTASGGWKEQVYLSTLDESKEYLIGVANYSGDLLENAIIQRAEEFGIPSILGFAGDVKIKIVILPLASVKETENSKPNNTAFSDSNANLSKKIIFDINKTSVLKNSDDQIRVNVSRSGDNSIAEEFTITADTNDDLELPLKIILNENESSNFGYVQLKPNTTFTGDKTIELTAVGGTYPEETTTIIVKEDKKISLSLDYPSDYSSKISSKIVFTLQASFSSPENKTITISSDNAKRIAFPEEVLLSAGETELTFEGTIVDSGIVDRKTEIIVYATATDYLPASKEIALDAINIPEFELTLDPDIVSEGDGIRATFASLRRTTQTDKEVFVTLTADQENRLILPEVIAFKEGELEKRFNIGTVNSGTVEGDQSITISSHIRFLDCNCIDESDATTITSQNITIIDNDGLALMASTSPSTIKAGVTNNTLTISRNTTDPIILQNPVEVTLSSNLPSVIDLPTSITIPANESEITISFDTQIDPNLEGDQNIRIEVNASDYKASFAWILITDQNLPDVIISDIELPNQVEAGAKVTVKSMITNQGYADFESGAKLEYYISSNNSTKGIKPFNISILPRGIAVGQSYEFAEEVQLPVLSGEQNLIVIINRDNAIKELSFTNNQNLILLDLLPAYTVTVRLDKETYKSGEEIVISGETKTSEGSIVSNSEVEIVISDSEFSRTFSATTNNNGAFVYHFTPLENESGNYSVKASYPGADIPAQKTFDILGFEFVGKPKYIKWEPFVGFPLSKEFILKNNTSVPLTGVQIQLPEGAVFQLEQTPITLEPGAQKSLGFTIISDEATIVNEYIETPIAIISNEGGSFKDLTYFYSKTKNANLIAKPINLSTTMVKGMTRNYEFSIQNIGDVDATEVEVVIPNAEWLNLKSPELIDVIKAGEEAKILLEFTPTLKEQLNVPISGTFVFKAKNSNSLKVPFRIETVSEATGSIVVDATDEYTYNTASAPHLAGAQVTIKHPFTGNIIAEGVTDEKGFFEVASINEGYYTVDVKAEKHSPYQNTILVDPSKTTFVNAFMQYQAVTYSWDVVRTEIEDEYDITLVTEFETNVPKPVIVMEVDNPKLDLEPGETRQVNLTITNHGLIEAFDVKLGSAQASGYEVTFLMETMDKLPAKTTVVVPVIIKRVAGKVANKGATIAANGNSSCPWLTFLLDALFICAGELELNEEFPMDIYGNCLPDINFDLVEKGGPGDPRGGGNGGGNGGGIGGPGFTFPSITFPNLCDSCFFNGLGAVLNCNPYTAGASALLCAYGFLVSDGEGTSLLLASAGCIPGWGCAVGLGDTALCVFGGLLGSKKELNSGLALKFNQQTTNFSASSIISEDFQKIADAVDAFNNIYLEYFQDSSVYDKEGYELFVAEIAPYIDAETLITVADYNVIKENLKDTAMEEAFLDGFFIRWNTTVKAWNQNIFSPNKQYPDIVDKNKLEGYNVIREELQTYITERGFISVDEMYESGYNAINEYIEEKSEEESSVCATVTIEFPQRLTMTREAFEGTLTISNESDKNLTEITLDLIITDELGVDKTNLFQINKDAFLAGTGFVNASESGKGVAIFIPTKEAAPEVPLSYSFGGILSYFDEEIGERVNITLNPVTLEVNPSPDLILDYFLQRDIIADDPLTENIVEPSLPAELSLMITNDGFGEAQNVVVESMQPRIVENEKGLAIDFEIIGSNFNNEPKQLGLIEVDFGTITPKTSAIGQWYFTSSLIGHFVKYDINVVHKSSFGNENLSLIKETNIHELIKSVKAYQDGNDAIADFLVNDISDSRDIPDRIFYSNGTSEEVIKAEAISYSNTISASALTTTITINPMTKGWNYDVMDDPGNKIYKITQIIRDADGIEIPLDNFWQTNVTLRDGLNPRYENKLHVLDKISEITTYTLYYVPRDANTPKIEAIEEVPDNESTASPVTDLIVKFNKEIDVNTFTSNNIKLVSQGEILDSSEILIGKIDATTYAITFQNLTNTSGYYELTISSVGVKDVLGNEGQNAMRVNWIQFLNELGVLKFESDQIKKQAINSVNITFNKRIREEEFTADKVTINSNPANNISITKIDDFNYTISGINANNRENNAYSMAIDLPQITAADGSKGLVVQKFDWVVDTNLPEVTSITPNSQGGIHIQNITEIDIIVNRPLVNTLEASSIVFTKNGQLIKIPVTIVQLDSLTYRVFGLGDYTTENGNYRIQIDQANLSDENDNSGEGIIETSWDVRLVALEGLTNVRITPDIGVSDSDNITSGDNIELVYETLEDNLTIEVYELLATSEVLFDQSLREQSGEYRIPFGKNMLGSRRFKLVAIDENGNRSEPEIVSMYIDFSDIVATIEPVKEGDNDCYDFDYVNVFFSEEIEADTFTTEAITINSSGIKIPKDKVRITKISNKNYRLENIQYEGDGLIELAIDKTKITKKSSGMVGMNTETKELGIFNKYEATVDGEENLTLNEIYTYTATANLNKYDWFIINGEIISSSENSVTVKWTEIGEQSLILRYQTPFSCSATVVTKVTVEGNTLSVNENTDQVMNLNLTPVPNNGQFSIHTSRSLNNCTIEIYSTTGQLIYTEDHVRLDKNIKNIDIQNIPSGIYILVIESKNEKFDFKFLVE